MRTAPAPAGYAAQENSREMTSARSAARHNLARRRECVLHSSKEKGYCRFRDWPGHAPLVEPRCSPSVEIRGFIIGRIEGKGFAIGGGSRRLNGIGIGS